MKPSRLVVALLAGVLLAACTSAGRSPVSDPFSSSGNASGVVTLLVQNLNFADARLYSLRRGTRRTLGIIGGKQDKTFRIPWRISDPLRIEINLLAGPSCSTGEIVADPGDVLELQIASTFSQSSFCR